MIFRKNKAVDENGTYYTPQIRVYRGNEEITSSMLDVFFTVSSFEDYRVEYIVAIGEVQKVFTTKINVIDTQSPKIAVREELPASMNFENVFELPAEDFYVEDNSGEKIDPQFSLVQMNGTIEKEMEQNDKGEYLFTGYCSAVKIKVSAVDSHNNKGEQDFIIANEQEEPIRFGKEGDNNSLWAGTVTNHNYSYS